MIGFMRMTFRKRPTKPLNIHFTEEDMAEVNNQFPFIEEAMRSVGKILKPLRPAIRVGVLHSIIQVLQDIKKEQEELVND